MGPSNAVGPGSPGTGRVTGGLELRKASPATSRTPYRGRDGWRLDWLWQALGRVRVERRVDRQGKLSLWDRPVRVGRRWADRAVVGSFAAERQVVVIRDERGAVLRELTLPWLTADWVWAGVAVTAPPVELCDTSTFR